MNVRSREWVVTRLLGVACLVTGAWMAGFFIMETSKGTFLHPITFVGVAVMAAFLCTIGMGLIEGKQ